MSVQDGVRISGQTVRYPWAGGPLERAAGEENFTQKGPAQGILPWKAQKQTKLARPAQSSRTASSVGLSSFLLVLVLALLARLLPPPCQQPRRYPFTTRDGSSVDHVRSHDVHAMSS